jgi:hypothetical protein
MLNVFMLIVVAPNVSVVLLLVSFTLKTFQTPLGHNYKTFYSGIEFVTMTHFHPSLKFVGKSRTVFTTLHFLYNLRIGPIS